MKKASFLLVLVVSTLVFQGCANFSQYYQAKIPLQKTPIPVPAQSVTGMSFLSPEMSQGIGSKRAIGMSNDLILKRHYALLGGYTFNRALPLTYQELAEMTAKAGGNFYIHAYASDGLRTGTRMVMTGYTTPSLITTTSQGSVNGNYNGSYQNNYGGYGNVSGNMNAYGYGSSQTFIPGQQTYQAQNFNYEMLQNCVLVFATPPRVQQLLQQGALAPFHY